MWILVYEHFSALPGPAPRELRIEGGSMLAALAIDLAAAGHRVRTALGRPGAFPGARRLQRAGVEIVDAGRAGARPSRDARGPASLARLLEDVEAAWIVAPETGGVLESLSRVALEVGKRLLGSSPAAVALTAGKLATTRRLEAWGVPVVPSEPIAGAELPGVAREWRFPLTVKPDDGVGSEGVGLVRSAGELAGALRRAREVGPRTIVQPYVAGTHASVSLAAGPRGVVALALQGQEMEVGRRFRYRGGVVPLASRQHAEALAAARAACEAVPGLAGWVGVDLVIASTGPLVLEVNPRLTTAYLGLRRACRENLAALALRALDGEEVVVPRLGQRVRFSVSGRVRVVPSRGGTPRGAGRATAAGGVPSGAPPPGARREASRW